MQEKADELYEKYLSSRLDLIFKTENKSYDSYYSSEKESDNKISKKKWTGKYLLVDKYGNIISDVLYDKIDIYTDEVILVEKDGKWNFINDQGKILFDLWYDFDNCGQLEEDYLVVYKNGKQNVINVKTGKYISKDWYDHIGMFYKNDAAIVEKGDWRSIMNKNGEIIYSWTTHKDVMYQLARNMDKNKVKKTLTGFQCTMPNGEKINTKYPPIKVCSSRFIVCHDKNDIGLIWDRKTNKYTKLCRVGRLEFNGPLVIDEHNYKVYFVYEDKIIDVSKYYYDKLKNKNVVGVKKGVTIISKDDFFYHNEEEIKKLVELEKEQDKKKAEEERKKEQTDKIRNMQASNTNALRDKEEEQKKTLEDIKLLLVKLATLQKQTGKFIRINVDNLFVDVGDHKEINPLYIDLGMLKYIDLSLETFENVKISGIDFRGCNINLKPQKVYERDLSHCNFEGLFIEPFMDFTDVDIRGTKFSRDDDPKTMDGYNTTLKDAIYNKKTTFDGISFVQEFGECEKKMHSK